MIRVLPEHEARAAELIVQRWAAVDALAVALIERGRLAGSEAWSIIEQTGAEQVADPWAKFDRGVK